MKACQWIRWLWIRWLGLAAGLVFFTLFCFGCHRYPGIQKPSSTKPLNVVLITIDTLRADHLGCYGHTKVKTPAIDRIAKEGVLFQRAFTPVPVTLPAHTSILTGLYPAYHKVRNNGTFKVDSQLVTLAEVLKEKGYQTGAFVGAFVLDSRYGLDQGFDFYNDYFEKDPNQSFLIYNERVADKVVKSAMGWLDQHHQQKFFLWLHCFDPHAPYEAPEPFASAYQTNPYDAEIAYVDAVLGKFFAYLDQKDLFNNTLVVITADHGEGLGEHAEKTHAIFLYESTLHVPLIMRLPGLIPSASIIDQDVCSVDIMPTVLDLLKIKADEASCQGQSLTKFLEGSKKQMERELFSETYYTLYNHHWSQLEGLRAGRWKFIKAPRSELYDLLNDPREMNNLFNKEKEIAKQLESRLLSFQKMVSAKQEYLSSSLPMDKDTQDRLKSLGYVWTTPSTAGKSTTFLPDPKDMITTLDYLNKGTYFYTLGDYEKAIEQFTLMLKVNPNDVFTHFVLGYMYDKSGLTNLAIEELKEAIRLDPGYVNAYNNLASIYHQLGRINEATEMLEAAMRLNPEYVELHENLGAIYFSLKRYDQARSAFQRAIELNPQGYQSYNNLGSVYLALGRFEEAEKAVLKALEINPSAPESLNNLGNIYLSQEKDELAIESFQKAFKLNPSNVQALVSLATVLIRRHKYTEARKFLENALEINQNLPNIHNCLGTVYLRQGKLGEAMGQFQNALQLDPNMSETYYNLGIVHNNLGHPDMAIEHYLQALDLDPANASARVNLGIIYFQQGKLLESRSQYEETLRLDPNHLEAHINLGVIYYQKGEYDKALQGYEKALALDPNSIQAHVNIGLTYVAKGLLQEAIIHYQKVLQIYTRNIEARINLASIFFNQGGYDRALEEYSEIVKIDPNNAVGYYGMGYCYFSQGLFDQATTALRQALFLKPDYLEARLLLDRALSIVRGN